MAKWFNHLFANLGDMTPIPDAVVPAGNVSFDQGYGPDYQRAKADPLSKNIERDKMNYLFNVITDAIHVLQLNGVPDWVDTPTNGGVAVSYPAGAFVRYTDGLIYQAIQATTALPTDTTNWVPYGVGIATVGGLTNADVTLTALQATRPIVVLSGVLTGNLNVIFPLTQKQWLIVNNTTGNFDITAKTAAGTGLKIDRASTTPVFGDGTNINGAGGTGRLIKVSVFSGAGASTWTKDSRTKRALFECYGAGGGGGGCALTGAGQIAASGGGGGGGYSSLLQDNPVSPQTITRGTGGTSPVGNGVGGTGGTTSCGTYNSAGGGVGGQGSASGAQANNAGGAGGGGAGGDVNLTGGAGGASFAGTATGALGAVSGQGGAAAKGTGGVGAVTGAAPGASGNVGGGGGSGGVSYNGSAAVSGGSGGFGYAIITEYA